jgi:hypothetical protein
MKAGNFCVGFMLVDLLCAGVSDCAFQFNLSPFEYEDFKKRFMEYEDENARVISVDYALVHNIVYEGVAFAQDIGIMPHKDFAIVKHFFQEDDDSIEVIDIPLGDSNDGRPVILCSPNQPNTQIITMLQRKLGRDGYHVVFCDNEGNPLDGDDDDDYEGEGNIEWELTDPESSKELFDFSKDDDMAKKIHGFLSHPLSHEKITSKLLKFVNKKRKDKVDEVNAILNDFAEHPYQLNEKPVADDYLYKIYNIILEKEPLTQQQVIELDVWNQNITIDSDPDSNKDVNLNSEAQKLIDEAFLLIEKEKISKVRRVLKQLKNLPEEFKTEYFFELVDEICYRLNDTKEALYFSEKQFQKFPSTDNKILYLKDLIGTFSLREARDEIGKSFKLCDVCNYNNSKYTVSQVAGYLNIMLMFFVLVDIRFCVEIMKIAKKTPVDYRSEFMSVFNFNAMSLIVKMKMNDEILEKI